MPKDVREKVEKDVVMEVEKLIISKEDFEKWFDKKRGFGFISGDNGKDYYVHHSHIYMRDAYKVLDTDDIVSFDVAMEIQQDMNRQERIVVRMFKKSFIKVYKLGITYGFNNK